MKKQKSNATTAAILLILFFISAFLWRYISHNMILATQNSARQRIELERLQALNELKLHILEISAYAILAIFLLSTITLLVILYRRQLNNELRSQNGRFPLVKNHIHGIEVYSNPNAMIAPQWAMETLPAQQQYSEDAQLRMSTAALAAGAINEQGIRNASQAKLASAYYRPRETERKKTRAQREALPLSVIDHPSQDELRLMEKRPHFLTFREALEQSTPDQWVIGQNEENGELAYFSPRTDVHGAIVGATGSGKTESSGLMVVIQALRQNLHVIVLDGKGGLDWRTVEAYTEWQAMDDSTLPQQIDGLHTLFQARMALLCDEQVANIHEMKRPLQPILILIEEFGVVYDTIKAIDKAGAKQIDLQLSAMFRLARAAGISFMIIDQSPHMWPKQVRANCNAAICYRLKGRLGQIFNEYHIHKLPVGSFSLGSQFYKAWHTKGELNQSEIRLPQLAHRYLPTFRGIEK